MFNVFGKLRAYFTGFGFTFLVLWSVMFLVVFGVSISRPALPYLVRDFLVEEAAVVIAIGYLNSIFNLLSTMANFSAGIFADRVGKRKIILVSLCLSPISFLLYFLSIDYYWLIVATLLLGFFHSLSSPPFKALIADIAPETSRAKAFAVFNLSWMLSGIPAPILGGFLSDTFNPRLPFIVAFTLSLPTLLLFLKAFKGTKGKSATKLSRPHSSRDSSRHYASYARTLTPFCIISLLLGFGDGILMPIITAFLMFRLGTSIMEMGIAFSVAYGIAMALSQIPGAKITEMFGKKRTILAGILIATPLLVLLPFTMSLIQFVAILGLNNFIGYLWSPALAAWVADHIETDRRSKAYGFTSAAYGLGSIAGPAIGGILWTFFQLNTLLPFVVGTIPFFLIVPVITTLKE